MHTKLKHAGIRAGIIRDNSIKFRLNKTSILFICIFAAIAAAALIAVKAATTNADLEICENSPVQGNAFIGHDHANASCGHYVSFGFEPVTNVNASVTVAASGMTAPVGIANSGVPGDNRLFIISQQGKIYVAPNNGSNVSGNIFLDLTSKVVSGGERGLLGIVFDPNYAQNGYFYVYYSTNQSMGVFNGQDITSGDVVLERYTRSQTDPDKADPNSSHVILGLEDGESNHNGGGLHFYQGLLYVSIGDGGGAGDTHTNNCSYGNAQCLGTWFGKILRIDVRNSTASQRYQVPSDNPFVGTAGAKPEIWHLGLRNPWRFDFDNKTGDMFIGDVGQNAWEEIDWVAAGSKGKNFGWRCYEGTHTYNLSGNAACNTASNFVRPIYEYDRSQGCSVIGGGIYRGTEHPEFDGTYVFSDYCTSKLWFLNKKTDGTWGLTQTVNTGFPGASVVTFGEDINGELYVGIINGTVYKINVSH